MDPETGRLSEVPVGEAEEKKKKKKKGGGGGKKGGSKGGKGEYAQLARESVADSDAESD